MTILVACIGNIFQGDDAFGCEVARALLGRTPARRTPFDDVRVVDFGIRGIDLTYALLDAPELTIFVDAVSRGGAPGTLYLIEPDLDDLPANGQMVDAHSMDPVAVLRTAKAMGGRLGRGLGRVMLVGCEPADLGGGEGRMGLTPAVSAAIAEAADIVESLIKKTLIQKEFQEVGR